MARLLRADKKATITTLYNRGEQKRISKRTTSRKADGRRWQRTTFGSTPGSQEQDS